MKSTNADKVRADASKIVERLRKFPAATVAGFSREYGVKPETVTRAIRTVICDEEFTRSAGGDDGIKRAEAAAAAEEAMHKANIAELQGETAVWYQCRGCGFDSAEPVLPCPKCGHLLFERIEQPIRFARRHAINE